MKTDENFSDARAQGRPVGPPSGSRGGDETMASSTDTSGRCLDDVSSSASKHNHLSTVTASNLRHQQLHSRVALWLGLAKVGYVPS